MSLTYGFCLDDPSSMYDSEQFSNAFHAVFGDGISQSGSKLLMDFSGFSATVAQGYTFVAGRWVSNDEPLVLTIQASFNNRDRTDALVARVDYKARKATLEILADVDLNILPDVLRSGDEYSVVLFLIRVRRGATTITPDDVTDTRHDRDFCGTVIPLSEVMGKVLYVYQFTVSGIDDAVNKIIALIQTLIGRADDEIQKLDAEIRKAGNGVSVGELQTARWDPGPGWFLCDGGLVPVGYPALSGMLGGTFPNISQVGDRYRTYIFAGTPVPI